MATLTTASKAVRLTRVSPSSISDLCLYLGLLQLPSKRTFHTSQCRKAAEKDKEKEKTKEPDATTAAIRGTDASGAKPDYLKLSPEKRAELSAKRARDNMKKEQEKQHKAGITGGSLSSSSIFGDELLAEGASSTEDVKAKVQPTLLSQRNFDNMARVLNPRPNARARWQRRMLIKHIRRGTRLTKEMVVARSERNHLVKSHWIKTSMKKLAPLTRQITGKSMDEAILQMRFSKKKAAQDVLAHLIQARNEAIAIKGMGLNSSQPLPAPGPVVLDPSITPAGPNQKASKKSKDGTKAETDMYVAQSWINRGPYDKKPEFRARGRVNTLRPPYTGFSVLLKEEKTRAREAAEKQEKVIRRRLGKNMWTQLPDRPVTNQFQHVLW